MHVKLMQLPRAVLIGRNAINQINFLCDDLKLLGKALIVTGKKTYKIAGKKACDILSETRDVDVVNIEAPSMQEVKKVKKIIAKEKPRFIVAVGGGKVIDVAKLASKESSLEFISVPTCASHDGIASSRASIKHNDGSVSIETRAPIGIIADVSIIASSPYRLTASGCGDIIAKFTAVKDWELSHRVNGEEISEYACALSLMTAKIIKKARDEIKKANEKSIRRVVKALISSGVAMSIAGSSRPGSGSEHKFSHALDMLAPEPALHGEQCGVGAIMMMYLHGGDWRDIRETLQRIGAPTTAEELGIKEEYIIKALVETKKIRPWRYTIIEHVGGLNERQARRIAKATGVIE